MYGESGRGTPRESDHGPENGPGTERSRTRALPLTPDLKEALLPWLDVDEVAPEELRQFLLTMIPLWPVPHGTPNPVRARALEERVTELARSLTECARDRARATFQASEYFRENRILARRLKALEALLRTRRAAEGSSEKLPTDSEAEEAAERYLPRG